MAEIKLTKNELRAQQVRLSLLDKYLPTLQLKKAMLQLEVSEARAEIAKFTKELDEVQVFVNGFSSVLTDRLSFNVSAASKIKEIKKHYENIAGVEVPYFEEVVFEPFEYSFFDTPAWVDGAVQNLRTLIVAKVKVEVAQEKKEALEKELREVSIRVNLFEKRLIPQALANIKKIKVFLGDQQLASVGRAKVAKVKIEESKRLSSQRAQ